MFILRVINNARHHPDPVGNGPSNSKKAAAGPAGTSLSSKSDFRLLQALFQFCITWYSGSALQFPLRSAFVGIEL
jgi:hypothetical protein